MSAYICVVPANFLQITRRSDLKHLCEACKRLHQITIPHR